jgi:peptidoglycan/xylan/chitin deacetylase (PgdA/CDA1 family)
MALMYHDVTVSAGRLLAGPEYFGVSMDEFRRHLDELGRLDLRAVSLEQAVRESGNDSRRFIAITFDDATAGQYSYAFPELVSRGMFATFFVVTDWIGRPGYASWDQLREMAAAGMSIQSHTSTHPFLSELDEAGVRRELSSSKGRLDAELRQKTVSLALPGGDAPRRELRRLIAEAGYGIVGTSVWGRNGVPRETGEVFMARRCTIRGEMSPARFRRVVLGDPWVVMRRRARDGVLRWTRRTLGPSRYARWRASFLGMIGRALGAIRGAEGPEQHVG